MANSDIKKKLLYVIVSLGRGGAEKQLFLLASNLNVNKLSVEVLAFMDGTWTEQLEKAGVKVTIIGSLDKFRVFWGCLKKIFNFKPDILHCFGSGAGFFARAAGVLLGVPGIIASERYAPETKGLIKLYLEKILGKFTDKLICNSEHAAKFYMDNRILNPEKVLVIMNGVETADKMYNVSAQENITIGYLANLRPGKNHLSLLNAFKILCDKKPNVKLLLAGDGICRGELEKATIEYGLRDHVAFLGVIADTSNFFSQLTLYVHPSHFEGTPNAIMEAMARGVPCVASDIPGNRALIEDGVDGLLIDPANSGLLAEKMLYLLSNTENLVDLGERAYRKVRERYGVDRMVRETERVYLEMLG